jgi:hypothetical protein
MLNDFMAGPGLFSISSSLIPLSVMATRCYAGSYLCTGDPISPWYAAESVPLLVAMGSKVG